MKTISKRAGRNFNNLGIGGRNTKKYWANISSCGSSGLFVKICLTQYITSCEVGRRNHLFSFVRKHLHTLRLDWLTFPGPQINQQEKIEGCSYARSSEITVSDPKILQPTFEAFSLLMVCALASARRGVKGMLPGCTASAVHAFTSFPTPRHCNETDSKQGSLGHHHMAAQQAQTTRTWRKNQDFTKLPRILRNNKKLLYIWREKKTQNLPFFLQRAKLWQLFGGFCRS